MTRLMRETRNQLMGGPLWEYYQNIREQTMNTLEYCIQEIESTRMVNGTMEIEERVLKTITYETMIGVLETTCSMLEAELNIIKIPPQQEQESMVKNKMIASGYDPLSEGNPEEFE